MDIFADVTSMISAIGATIAALFSALTYFRQTRSTDATVTRGRDGQIFLTNRAPFPVTLVCIKTTKGTVQEYRSGTQEGIPHLSEEHTEILCDFILKPSYSHPVALVVKVNGVRYSFRAEMKRVRNDCDNEFFLVIFPLRPISNE